MPLSMLGTFGNTFVFEPSTTVQTWTNPGPYTAVVIYCNRGVYLRLDETVTDQDFYFDDTETYTRVRLDVGAQIAFLLGDTDTTGGQIRFTLAGDDW